jgi:hypothetical protein
MHLYAVVLMYMRIFKFSVIFQSTKIKLWYLNLYMSTIDSSQNTKLFFMVMRNLRVS